MKKLLTSLIVLMLISVNALAGGAVSIQEASGRTATQIQADISSAVSNGNTDITLQFARGGTWGSAGSDITIAIPAGVTKLTLTYDPATSGAIPVLNLASFTYADALMTGGLTLNGVKIFTGVANRYLISSASNTNFPASITITNCWVEGHRGLFVLGTYTNTVSKLSITNSVVKSIGTNGVVSTGTSAASTLVNVDISNNTFIDCNAVASSYFIDYRSPNAASTVFNFSNNTVYYGSGQLGNGFFRLYNVTAVNSGNYTFNNNLFAAGVSGTTFRFGYGTYTGMSGSGNYYSSNLGTASTTNSVTFTKYTENNPSNLFKSPSTYDFTLNDPNFAGNVSAGDPRWYFPATVNITGGTLVGLDYNLDKGPSVAKSFTLNTIVLRGAVALTAPSDFEISTDNTTFTNSLTIGGPGSELVNQIVYARLKSGLALGTYTEVITVSTTGAAEQTVSCTGTVTNALPLLSTPTGLTTSSVTYTGFHASWNAVANAANYTLQLLLNGAVVSTISGISTNTYDFTGLTPGGNYRFMVTATGDGVNYNSSAESVASSSVTLPFIYLFTSVNDVVGGTISRSLTTPTYSPNAQVQLTASKNFGYAFVNWVDSVSGSVLSTAPTLTVSMDATKHIQAVFSPVTTYNYTVNIAGSQWGKVSLTPAPTNGKYEAGTVVTMSVVSNSVTLFKYWEDASTVASRTITVDGDKTFTATFEQIPFIVGWDFRNASPASDRQGDYYAATSNTGLFALKNADGTSAGWLASTGRFSPSYPCAQFWSAYTTFATPRYYQVTLSTVGYTNIRVNSMMSASYHAYPVMQLLYSTDGTNFTKLKDVNISSVYNTGWINLNDTLPVVAENQTKLYLRWLPDNTSSPTLGSALDVDGTAITNIFVFADSVYIPDPDAPKLISATPAEGASTVSANGSIILTFDEAVKAGTGNATLGSTALAATFGAKTVVFSYSKLSYNTDYSFTVPAGVITDKSGNPFAGMTLHFHTMNRPNPAVKLFDAVIARDGTGDYTSVQAAINAAPAARTQPWLIFIKNGTYKEHVDIPSTKPYMNLIGQSRDSVIISGARLCGASSVYPDSAVYSVDPGATVVVKSANCYFENICFENEFGVHEQNGPQALAIYTNNDRMIFKNCWLRSYQDTYLTGSQLSGRGYLQNCLIQGAVDFIYGMGDFYFDKCTIRCTRPSGGYIVAPNHPAATKWGYVFRDCTLDGPAGVNITTYLGRPWHDRPKTSFFNTISKINIYPVGWYYKMGGIPAIFADYNTMDANGNSLDLSQRISTYQIDSVKNGITQTYTYNGVKNSFTDTEAATYTYDNVMAGTDSWDPKAIIEPTDAPTNVSVTASGLISWDVTQYSICYVITRNNKVIGFTKNNYYNDAAYNANAVYKVIAVAESGALSTATTAGSILTDANVETKLAVWAKIHDNQLVVSNLPAGADVTIFSFSGCSIAHKIVSSSTVTFNYAGPCLVKVKAGNSTEIVKVLP